MLTAKIGISGSGNYTAFYIDTTSTSGGWGGAGAVNTGQTLRWSVSGGIIVPEVVNDNPSIDLTANAGTANIRVRNRDRLQGVETLTLLGQNITGIDITRCRNLTGLILQDNPALGSIDLSQNNLMEALNLQNCGLSTLTISNMSNLGILEASENSLVALDVTNNSQLYSLSVSNNNLDELDIAQNLYLTTIIADNNLLRELEINDNESIIELRLQGNRLSSSNIDNILISLDTYGLSNGHLDYSNQIPVSNPTLASLSAYNNLVAKGWTIIGNIPA